MTELNLNNTVGQWVAHSPSTSRVFEAVGIDYCCGGNKPLERACAERRIDLQGLLGQLQEAATAPDAESGQTWIDAPLDRLCDHIEVTHHAYLKAEVPRLTEMVAKVVRAHGDNHPEMAQVQEELAAFQAEVQPHMYKEEHILFPAIRLLARSAAPPAFPFGTIANPIRMMEYEHDVAGNALKQIRELTSDFRIPAGACNTYRALLDGLHELEQDMHRHVHKENSILFPRAVELEQLLVAG